MGSDNEAPAAAYRWNNRRHHQHNLAVASEGNLQEADRRKVDRNDLPAARERVWAGCQLGGCGQSTPEQDMR